MTLIFVCSPVRMNKRWQRIRDIRNARRYCRMVCENGCIPFSPILFFTRFLNFARFRDRAMGFERNLIMISRCDELWVFGAPTLEMKIEIEKAKEHGVPIRRFDAKGRALSKGKSWWKGSSPSYGGTPLKKRLPSNDNSPSKDGSSSRWRLL